VVKKCRYPDLAGRGGTPEENELLDRMQAALPPLDEDARRIRLQIATLEFCDSGLSLSVEELLRAIGDGKLPEPSCRPGCCWEQFSWWRMEPTQPRHVESMKAIQAVLQGYLDGTPQEELSREYPHSQGFIGRVHEWLGPREALAGYQELMLERILLPFEVWTRWTHTWETPEGVQTERKSEKSVHELLEDIFVREDGRGRQLDTRIAEAAGLPPIYDAIDGRSREMQDGISEPAKRELYRVCARITEGAPNICDCNHPTFRRIENWIHGVGRGTLEVPTHESGAHRLWLDRLVFAYALALDKWLLEVPMQFLLLDLEHVSLGFNPRSEIMRVYKALGKKTPVKEWLAASLWTALQAGRKGFRQSLSRGVNTREWMEGQLVEQQG